MIIVCVFFLVAKCDEISYNDTDSVIWKLSRKYWDRDKGRALQEALEVQNKVIFVFKFIVISKNGYYDCVSMIRSSNKSV